MHYLLYKVIVVFCWKNKITITKKSIFEYNKTFNFICKGRGKQRPDRSSLACIWKLFNSSILITACLAEIWKCKSEGKGKMEGRKVECLESARKIEFRHAVPIAVVALFPGFIEIIFLISIFQIFVYKSQLFVFNSSNLFFIYFFKFWKQKFKFWKKVSIQQKIFNSSKINAIMKSFAFIRHLYGGEF